MDLLKRLPKEIEEHIYEFNPEHRVLFNCCLKEIENKVSKVNHIEYYSRGAITGVVRDIINELIDEFVETEVQDP